MIDRPGFKSNGRGTAYWVPSRAVKGSPAYLVPVRLFGTDEQMAGRCRELTAQLRTDMAPPEILAFSGTIAGLIENYRRDETSSLHRVKHSTRVRDYEPSLRVLEKNVGTRNIAALKASDFTRWYEQWRRKGHRRAAGAIKLLRAILSYGAGERLHGCSVARQILSGMRFDQPLPRDVVMTYEQCAAIVRKSIEMGCPSIGFVEAVKFETALRRIDVIGEYVPGENGGAFKWRGLMGSDVKNGVLSLKTSKTGARVGRDLFAYPLVAQALTAYRMPDIGPLVIDEDTGKPYWENRYTPKFRKVRDAAGVSSDVWSMDTRAGAVTETVDATGSLEDGRDLATHTTTSTTRRYNRGDGGLKKSRKIAEAREETRK
jgi:hypothetical protein